ncbi:MAG: tetratricopeptide repeat protein [Candidatus Sericytochromatia bacterium]|nr:tetratricopeptide repeat protein [Candidatus Sericytochromatia bacterium]
MNSNQDPSFYQLGLELQSQKKYPEARAAFRKAWQQEPSDPAPLLASAAMECSLNDLAAAHGLLAELLAEHPQHPEVNLALGRLFHRSGQLKYAIQYYRQSLEADPDQAQAWLQLGRFLFEIGQTDSAYDACQEALKRQPDLAEAHYLLGLWHYQQNASEAARHALSEACRLRPDQAHYHLSLGLAALLPPTDAPAAMAALVTAVGLDPALADNLTHVGIFFLNRQLYHLAWPFFSQAQQAVSDTESRFKLHLYQAQCALYLLDMQQALDHWQAAQALYPERWYVKLSAQLCLPLLYRNATEQARWLQRLRQQLTELQDFSSTDLPRIEGPVRLNLPLLALSCQAREPRPWFEQISRICQQIIRLPQRESYAAVPGRCRVGLLTSSLNQYHFVGVYRPLLEAFAARGQRVQLFSLRRPTDDHMQQAWEAVADCHWLSPQSLEQTAIQLLEAELDLLIHPVVGQSFELYLLAQARFAPVQVALYGHPVSSAAAGIDYFAVPAAMAGAPEAYSEKCLALPGLPYLPPAVPEAPPFQRRAAGLPAEAHLCLIPGELYYMSLLMDPLIARILGGDPLARVLMFKSENPVWEHVFQQRLAEQLSPDQLARVHFMPAESQSERLALLKDADLVLDTLPFNQLYWVYQALRLGVPVLSCRGTLLRDSQSAGLFTHCNLNELIAENPEALADQALILLKDAAARQRLQQALLQAAQAQRLQAPQDALQWAEHMAGLLS